jgi:hypothetical protein
MGEVTQHPKARGAILSAPARFNSSIHDVSNFDCGKPTLNDWLRSTAARSEGTSARTYVACESRRVIGYYCIAAGAISRSDLPIRKHGLPDPVPVTIIGRLARDLTYKGTGLGSDLLADAIKRILFASETIGVRGVVVHALDGDSIPFYTGNGFLPCPIGDKSFFLPIETIRAAIA